MDVLTYGLIYIFRIPRVHRITLCIWFPHHMAWYPARGSKTPRVLQPSLPFVSWWLKLVCMLFMPFMKPSPVITYVGSDALRKGRIPCVTRGALFCSAVKRRLSQFSLFTLSLSLSLSPSWCRGIPESHISLSLMDQMFRDTRSANMFICWSLRCVETDDSFS